LSKKKKKRRNKKGGGAAGDGDGPEAADGGDGADVADAADAGDEAYPVGNGVDGVVGYAAAVQFGMPGVPAAFGQHPGGVLPGVFGVPPHHHDAAVGSYPGSFAWNAPRPPAPRPLSFFESLRMDPSQADGVVGGVGGDEVAAAGDDDGIVDMMYGYGVYADGVGGVDGAVDVHGAAVMDGGGYVDDVYAVGGETDGYVDGGDAEAYVDDDGVPVEDGEAPQDDEAGLSTDAAAEAAAMAASAGFGWLMVVLQSLAHVYPFSQLLVNECVNVENEVTVALTEDSAIALQFLHDLGVALRGVLMVEGCLVGEDVSSVDLRRLLANCFSQSLGCVSVCLAFGVRVRGSVYRAVPGVHARHRCGRVVVDWVQGVPTGAHVSVQRRALPRCTAADPRRAVSVPVHVRADGCAGDGDDCGGGACGVQVLWADECAWASRVGGENTLRAHGATCA
jgi:hypothetical protein